MRDRILREIRSVAAAQDRTLAPLTDDLALAESGLDSLCFAILVARLRRENHRLRQERDILAKAAAWFARESKASPNGFTGS